MPVGRPDFWYGQILLFEQVPTDGRTDAGPTSDWAHDHVGNPTAHGPGWTAAQDAAEIAVHTAIAAAHHAKTVSADIDHGSVGGLADDDHTQYLRTDGTRFASGYPRYTEASNWAMYHEGGVHKVSIGSSYVSNLAQAIYNVITAATILWVDLAGNLSLLGTVDGVDIAAHAAAPSAHHLRYVDRGDPAAADKVKANLTCDSTWRDWDLSGIVPAGASAVLIRVYMQRDDAAGSLLLRKKGNSNSFNVGGVTHGEAGTINWGEITVACNANRVIQYFGIGATWTALNLTVAGWWG